MEWLSMPNDLETNLVRGGVSPAAAKVIANAIANVATDRLTTGTNRSDNTPVEKMRLIDSDTRRYTLPNLDHPKDSPFRSSVERRGVQFSPRDTSHPYADSQPATSSPRLDTGTVKAGKYISVSQATTNEVAQSEVGLRVTPRGGLHARLNPATGEIESVPFLIEIAPQNRMEATVEERPEGTVLRLRFLT